MGRKRPIWFLKLNCSKKNLQYTPLNPKLIVLFLLFFDIDFICLNYPKQAKPWLNLLLGRSWNFFSQHFRILKNPKIMYRKFLALFVRSPFTLTHSKRVKIRDMDLDLDSFGSAQSIQIHIPGEMLFKYW